MPLTESVFDTAHNESDDALARKAVLDLSSSWIYFITIGEHDARKALINNYCSENVMKLFEFS